MAGIPGQRPGLGDPGDREQHPDRVPAARCPQIKVDRARRIDSRGAAGSAARLRAKLVTKFL
jgi:hypothetical protein